MEIAIAGKFVTRMERGRRAGVSPVVFGTQNARGVLPLSPREERAGRESERGVIDKKRLLSPVLSSFFEEERERKRGCALKANLLPNTTGVSPAQSGHPAREGVVACPKSFQLPRWAGGTPARLCGELVTFVPKDTL